MKAREAIKLATKETGITQEEGAARLGLSPTQFSSRVMRGSLRADDFMAFMDAIGVDVVLKSRESGKVLASRVSGAGRRVRKMVNRVTYDTATADALSNNFFSDGVHEYTDGRARELYIDKEGRYFFAEYTDWEGGTDSITLVSAADAVAFIAAHGTDIIKTPAKASDPEPGADTTQEDTCHLDGE